MCMGIIGVASSACLSLGTPTSISFWPVTASAAPKPSCETECQSFIVNLKAQCQLVIPTLNALAV